MPRHDSWQDLKKRFEEAIRRSHKNADVDRERVWKVLVEHPWYKRELRKAAKIVARFSNAPSDCVEDIESEAVVLLGESLRRAADLRMDRQRAEEQFPGWMATIILNHCRMALRHLRRSNKPALELRQETLPPARDDLIIMRMDLTTIVEELGEIEEQVFTMRLKGMTFREIAIQLDSDYSAVRRTHERVKRELRKYL